MRVFTEIQRFDQWWLKLLMLVVFLITFGALAVGYTKIPQKEISTYLLTSLPAGIITILVTGAIFLVRLETKIDNIGVHYGFWPFQKNLRTATWHEIEKIYVRKYRPLLEYGGWGYKTSLQGRGKVYNTKGNMGIQIVFKDNRKTLIGTQQPDIAKKVIDNYISKETTYEN